jgi:hypothetical protein
MKRGKKPALTNLSRTLSGNDLRKRLRLIGPMIGCEFALNPDPKMLNKKSKSGRTSMNLVDAEWLQTHGPKAPDNTLAIMGSNHSICTPAASFNTGLNSIWGDSIDELAVNLLSSLYTNLSGGNASFPTILGWGSLNSRLAAKNYDAATQALSAGLQSWGASRVVIQRMTSAIAKIFSHMEAPSEPIDIRLGSDGLLCEISLEFHGTDLFRDEDQCLKHLMQIPCALTAIEKLPEGFRIRIVSRAHSLGLESAVAGLIVFNSQPAAAPAANLSKAS